MKKIISILAYLGAATLGTACSDVIDLTPSDRFSPATVWSTETTADSYLIGLYSIFGSNTEFYTGSYTSPKLTDAFSDILKSTSWDQYNHPYNKALLQLVRPLRTHPPRKRIPARRPDLRSQIRRRLDQDPHRRGPVLPRLRLLPPLPRLRRRNSPHGSRRTLAERQGPFIGRGLLEFHHHRAATTRSRYSERV